MKSLSFLALTCSLSLAEIEIYPTLHFIGVIGDTTADSLADVGGHAHDPNTNDLSVQGLDVGLNVKVDDWFAAFVNMNAFTDADRELDAELEEAFAKFQNLPGGFEIRAGRFLNRSGLQNNRHLHSWNFVNANLTTSQFLGEEGLFTEGVELNWFREFDQSFIALTASYGNAPEHDHHGEEEHDEHEDEDEEHEEEAEHEEEHGHESAEGALFNGKITTARALFGYNNSDFHQHRLGFNGAWGENGYDRDTSLFSADYTYTWRENGLESGGRAFSIGAEHFYRDVQWTHAENAANQGSTSQSGYMAFAQYRFAEQWIADLRYEHLEGSTGGPELDMGEIEYAFSSAERDRLSLALTYEFEYKELDSYIRTQYSHDKTDEGDEDSIFLQVGFNFGQGEVR
jgi:hypothetical protein